MSPVSLESQLVDSDPALSSLKAKTGKRSKLIPHFSRISGAYEEISLYCSLLRVVTLQASIFAFHIAEVLFQTIWNH